jgi:hypothetical protein
MLEEIYLSQAVKMLEHNMVKQRQNLSKGKRNHKSGNSLQHLKQKIYNQHSLAISNQTTTIASPLILITSLLIKTNSLLNSKTPGHQ